MTDEHSASSVAFPCKKEAIVNSVFARVARFGPDEAGISAVEYGLLAALIALVIFGGVQLLGTNLNAIFSNLADSV